MPPPKSKPRRRRPVASLLPRTYRVLAVAFCVVRSGILPAKFGHAFVPLPTRVVGGWSKPEALKTPISPTELGMAADGDRSSVPTNRFWNQLESMVFGFLDEESGNDDQNGGENTDDPRLVLAEWNSLLEWVGDENERIARVESLTNFLEVWARLTLSDDKGLTTPVSCSKFKATGQQTKKGATATRRGTVSSSPPIPVADPPEHAEHLEQQQRTMKLVFRPPKRYLSYKEQKSMEKGVLPDRKGAKVDAWSPGGVEITVTTTTTKTTTPMDRSSRKQAPTLHDNPIGRHGAEAETEQQTEQRHKLGVVVRRCDIDGDTVIKKTTERAIVRRLEDALRIWKKNNALKQQERQHR